MQRAAKAAAADAARRWSILGARSPELVADLVRLGGVLALRPTRFEDGVELPEPIDPVRLGYEQGQRDLAVKLLALMSVSGDELAKLMEVSE